MNTFVKSWKTAALGVIQVVTALGMIGTALINGTAIEWEIVGTMLLGGIGLIFARDADKSSQDSGIRP